MVIEFDFKGIKQKLSSCVLSTLIIFFKTYIQKPA